MDSERKEAEPDALSGGPVTPFVPDAPPGSAGGENPIERPALQDEDRQFSVSQLLLLVAVLAGWLGLLQVLPEKVNALAAGMGTLLMLGAMALGGWTSLAARLLFWGMIVVYVCEIGLVMWRQAHAL